MFAEKSVRDQNISLPKTEIIQKNKATNCSINIKINIIWVLQIKVVTLWQALKKQL